MGTQRPPWTTSTLLKRDRPHYRSEIDGLRSLAIVPVVCYHAGIAALPGGFTGVDVFFVISGFLITGLILGDMGAGGEASAGGTGRFSIADFYKRRALRIMPALVVTLVATAFAAWAIMLPNEFIATGRSLVAAALFVSNIHFWLGAGYFEATSELKPLLHTWSLAVEEQFYIFFPLLLIAVARWGGRRFRLWIGLASAGSFALCMVAVHISPAATFFLLPTRGWELGLGALIAAGGVPRITSARAREVAAAAGILLIGLGVFTIAKGDVFPSWNALYPCLGAGLVLACGAGTAAGRLLSLAPLVYIGRISYSLYLWHWPVIVFERMLRGPDLTPARTAEVIALSFLLAVLSFNLVEKPFRTPGVRRLPAWRVLRPAAAGILGMAVLGGAIAATGGSWRNYPPEVLQIAAYTGYPASDRYAYQFGSGDGCSFSGYTGGSYKREACLQLAPDRPNYLVIGDSHAGALWRAITLAYPQVHVIHAWVSGCRPLLNAEGEAPCRETMNFLLGEFVPSHRIDGIIIAGRWRTTDFDELVPTLRHLSHFVPRIVVFGPTVEYKGEFPLLLAQKRLNGDPNLTRNAIDPSKKPLSDAIGKLVVTEKAAYVPTYDLICPPGAPCLETTPEGAPMQFDYGHLTFEGAKAVVRRAGNLMPVPAG